MMEMHSESTATSEQELKEDGPGLFLQVPSGRRWRAQILRRFGQNVMNQFLTVRMTIVARLPREPLCQVPTLGHLQKPSGHHSGQL